MKTTVSVVSAMLALSVGATSASASVAYSMQFRTNYAEAAPADAVGGITGQPDTGYVRFVNNGPNTFTGTFTLFGVAPSQTIDLSFTGTLTPGASLSLVAGPESSNQGGFNKVSGAEDLGLLIGFAGTVTDGGASESVNFQAYDGAIHSGMPRMNPFGVTLDTHVLQGGDSFGRDTGDAYEESQATGVIEFQQVPAPGALTLLAIGGIAGVRRRR